MLSFSADDLTSLTADLSAHVLATAREHISNGHIGADENRKLQHCLRAGIMVLLASITTENPPAVEQLSRLFREFFRSPTVGRELAAILQGKPLHVAKLTRVFKETSGDTVILSDLDLEKGLIAFQAAFVAAAIEESVLQNVVQTGQSPFQIELDRKFAAPLRALLNSFDNDDLTHFGIQADRIIAKNVVSGVQIVIQVPRIDWVAPDSGPLKEAYLHHVFEMSDYLSLADIVVKTEGDKTGAYPDLASVYTPLLTFSPETQERLARGEAPDQEVRWLSALAQLDRHSRLALIGEPGSGKSTFVSFVAICLAGEVLKRQEVNLKLLTAPLPDERGQADKERQSWSHGDLLPVRVALRDFATRGLPPPGKPATAKHLRGFISAELKAADLDDYADHLFQELRNKGGLLLFDGLDEAPEAGGCRDQIRQAIKGFAVAYPRCRILITSRPYAFESQEWQKLGFVEAVLAPFSRGQTCYFVDHWYDHIISLQVLDTSHTEHKAELLKLAITESDRLQTMAERPLLLTLMAYLHAYRDGSLQEEREKLYSDAVELLLNRWETRHMVPDSDGQMVIQPGLTEWLNMDRQKTRDFLNKLAYIGHKTQPTLTGTADVPEMDLVYGLINLGQNPDVRPVRLVEYLSQQVGLLRPRREGVFTFPHISFQEYLAACYLVDHGFPDLVADLAREEPSRWREVVLLAGAKAARRNPREVWTLAEALCDREPTASDKTTAETWGAFLAGQLLVETAKVDRASKHAKRKVERVQRWLVEILNRGDLPAAERVAAGRTLALLGDPRPEVTALEETRFCYIPPGPFWMGEGGDLHLNQNLDYGYWIAQRVVTNAQFQAFINDNGYGEAHLWRQAKAADIWEEDHLKLWYEENPADKPYDFGKPFNLANHPVVGITWYEAVAFAQWLTEQWQQKGLLPEGWEIRLPSEMEWEKAARGGIKIPLVPTVMPIRVEHIVSQSEQLDLKENPFPRRRFSWGDEHDTDRANCEDTYIGTTSAVGCFQNGVSPYGVEDLSGNVWEWTRSLWGAEDFRVLRGGSFLDGQGRIRCSVRVRTSHAKRGRAHGFRVAVVPV